MARYFNSMLTGPSRTIKSCQEVYDRLKGYNIFVMESCGFGIDGTCNKHIKYTGEGGIQDVRNAFATVIKSLHLELNFLVNSKKKCVF